MDGSRPLLGAPDVASGRLFAAFGALVVLSVLTAAATEWYVVAGLPALVLMGYLTFVNFRAVFYLLLASIPLSKEVQVSASLGTDLPTEPLIVGLMLVALVLFLQRWRVMGSGFMRHPITLLVVLHVGWIVVTTLTSELFLVSFKYLVAKLWYVGTFFFLAGYLLREERDVRWLFWLFFVPLMFTVVVINVRHASFGFSFMSVNSILSPFQRNHVSYAATMTLFFPFVALALGWYRRGSLLWWILALSLPVLLVAIWLTFTRAAFVSLVIAFGVWVVLRLRLMRVALAAGLVVVAVGLGYVLQKNTYLDYAPNYERTITHTDFGNLVEATYKMEDISTMERVYRWVAGLQMFHDHPVMGFGPGNFPKFYRSYTVTSFRTYVSENLDDSGIHSYFFMVLVEQGVPGLLLFLALVVVVLVRAEDVYHRSATAGHKRMVLMALLCFVVILSFLLINDLVETDKVGSFFFMCMAMLVNFDLASVKSRYQ